MLCALVQNNMVTAVQDLDDAGYQNASKSCQIVIDISATVPQPQIGWIFSGSILVSNGTNSMQITKLAFRERITTGELVGIYTAKPSNPVIQLLMDNQALATYVDLTRSDTISGVMYLVSIGLLTSDRANVILTTPPTASEVYTG